jgi:uncharacterized SAM-binding protein YcdF (DUF218 family)
MNELFVSLGIEAWKPWLSTLVMPPIPFLLLALVGARLLPRWRGLGWTVLLAGVVGLWGACTTAVGGGLIRWLNKPPPVLEAAQRNTLAHGPRTTILVLGAGRRWMAPEYGSADLSALTWERVRYGVWLARQTGLPLAYSGGIGHGSMPGPSEAQVVRQVLQRDYGMRLQWAEDRSRDTNENALFSLPLLRAAGTERIVLVTHGFHQRRALAGFQRAMLREGFNVAIVPAPVGLAAEGGLRIGDFLPGSDGLEMTRLALHEWLGLLAGA